MNTKRTNTKKNTSTLQWSDAQADRARAEGWELAMVVDEGRPAKNWYYMVWPLGGKPRLMYEHLISTHAKKGSGFHQETMALITASRMPR